ncbi:LysE family transporter [Paenibacillus sp. FSL K6-0276]|uniref:LysE family translocator n=1 Tax=Paenibacillus sp. FSL K6-0276 TaxID=2921450 RepID=UPI0030EDE935
MNIISFLIYCVVATFTPGPANIVILSSAQHSGAKKSMSYVYGATMAFGLLLILSTLLNRVLVEVIPNILIIMQVIGSLYMLYLAYKIFKIGSMED